MRILKLNNIDDIQRETGVSVVKRAKLIGSNTICRYRLLEELTFQLTNGEIITVPVGFEWDLSSSPRWAWLLVPPDGDFDSASLIHDYIYINKPYGSGERARWFADLEMYKWSVVTNGTHNLWSLRNLDNVIRYLGVMIAGWWTWYKVGDKIKNIFKKK